MDGYDEAMVGEPGFPQAPENLLFILVQVNRFLPLPQ
jgi:hypothetical protein